jgi:putative transposase
MVVGSLSGCTLKVFRCDPRAGAAITRVGRDPAAPPMTAGGSLHAHLDGFDLHAAVAVPAGDRNRLEHLCRYVLRPPLAQERLELTGDGKVLLRLRRAWHDGTRAIRFEPTEFLEKLAAMIPKPRINLLVYHGVFAPHASRRPEAVRRAQEPRGRSGISDTDAAASNAGKAGQPGDGPNDSPAAPAMSLTVGGAGLDAPTGRTARPPPPARYTRPKHYAWADLLRRAFAIDVLACPDCGGRLRLIATIDDRDVIEKILRHLGLPVELPTAVPARVVDWLPGVNSLAEPVFE